MKDCILYIDDEQENLESFQIAFWMYYDISLAHNTLLAREIIKKKEIKVIITDQRMPNETGLDFIKDVVPEYPDIVYMVLSGYSDINVVIEAINNGSIYRFIMKPWDMHEMRQTIENAIENFNLKKNNKSLLIELTKKNNQLKTSERKFRNIFNCSLDSICIISKKGKILEVNAITSLTSGKTRDELLNTAFIGFFPIAKQVEIKNNLKILQEEKEVFFESSFVDKSGREIDLDFIAREIDYIDDKAFLIVARNITEKKEVQQRILKSTILAEERERTRIAQELHDGIGPLLSSIKLYVETYFSNQQEGFRQTLESHIIETIDDTIDHIAAISNNLSPHMLKNFGLKAAIEKFCSKIEKGSKIKISTAINFDERFDEGVEITIYRVVIELINNTLKHARAKNIRIELNKGTETISMLYSDDGKGFDVNLELGEQKGMGLYNIKNRIESLDGEIHFHSIPSKITQVKLLVPYEQN